MKRKASITLLLALLLLLWAIPGSAAETGRQVTILFTHDLHSHLLPAADEAGGSYGGYARLKTAIDAEKARDPNALLVDAGDFSMGTLFQTIFATDAAELRIMGAMGYDVITFGNHEYDYQATGLAAMLHAAAGSGEPLPRIVEANYLPPREGEQGYGPDAAAVWEAFARYGVEDYTVIQRGGVNFALFGLMGLDSHESAPMSGMVLHDPVETAGAMAERIEAEVPEPRIVICLSHGGTNPDKKKSEDERLAREVQGIDVIVSGHTHTTLEEPILVGDTYIVSCQEYGKNLGVLTLEEQGGGYALAEYRLVPIDENVPEDPAMAAQIEEYAALVGENYLSRFGDMTFDQVLAQNPHRLESLSELGANHREAALGNLIADSYRWAVEQAEGGEGAPVDFALTANGVIRESLPEGDVTVEHVFNALSLGIGADQVPGYPLVSVYLTGEDLKNAFEVDASVTAIMPAAQLYFTGMEFTFNPNRMIFDKVTSCAQVLEDGSRIPIEDDRLYRVVTGLYCGQMLGAVNDKSFGILSITPRDSAGNPITDLAEHIVHDGAGNEVKEWHALASYLKSLGTVPEIYGGPEGRKMVEPSWNPVELLKNPNWLTLAALGVILLVIAGILLLLWGLRRRRGRN